MDKGNVSVETDKELIDKLLRMVKREVKQIMEEAVTRKFVHEDSSSIISLCAAVDACLSNGLKRRALGLFKTNSTTALLQKVAKNCEVASLVLKKVTEVENADPNKRSSSSSDSLNKNRMSFKMKSSQNMGSNNSNCSLASSPKVIRFLWIRIALFNKHLVEIVDHVVHNSSKYYEKDALVADPVAGQILASLLVGPCALDYTKMKSHDQYWTDPPADELVQRHRISSKISSANSTSSSPGINQSTPPTVRKPLAMSHRRVGAVGSCCNGEDDHQTSSPVTRTSNICWSPRDYVESLHQNSKSTLLYGKNNVIMQPTNDIEALPGYLSLHQEPYGLFIKWTPNQLINGRTQQQSSDLNDSVFNHSFEKTTFWNFALNVNVENIVYLHCHQQRYSCGSIVMVGRDGVMHPPIKFPKGGHLLSFLSCLETGLMPYGQLDPPLWSEKGKGKVFPKLRRKGHSLAKENGQDCHNEEEEEEEEEDIASDYVFRIISICEKPDTISPEMFEPKVHFKANKNEMKAGDSHKLKKEESDGSAISKPINIPNGQNDLQDIGPEALPTSIVNEKQHIQLLCDTMKKQIISRAFYGWLAYCRHLKTVRTHLADLVNPTIIGNDEPTDASNGITKNIWEKITNKDEDKIDIDLIEFYRLVYYGGVEHSIRPQVWLYLLEHYKFEDTKEVKKKRDMETRQKYEMIMSDWLAVEAIVRQRDKEIVAANLAKLSSESNNSTSELPFSFDKSMFKSIPSNDVFEANDEFETNESRRTSVQSEKITEQDKHRKSLENLMLEKDADNAERASASHRKQLIRHKQINSLFGNSTGSLQNIFITNPSIDQVNTNSSDNLNQAKSTGEEAWDASRLPVGSTESGGSQCVSPASSNGGLYSNELLDLFSLNLHRIDKDVQRCDRNFWYFSKENLEKLRNVMCTYVWEHLEIGYVQGMCDLVAPLLVIFDDEVFTYSCFGELMKRMASNFPHGGAMDTHFANMRSLIQILDADIFDLMHQNGDYTHFYFCYRWFLLDFKRELVYNDVFSVWETIWAAKHVSSSSFVLFIALALVEYYRDIILENNMDFTDIIKFFNEMAERHDAKAVLCIARDLVHQIQSLIENK